MSQTPGSWQSNNFTDELGSNGLQAPNRVEKIFDFNLGLGGPIMKNKLWFFGSFRRWGVDQTVTDSFYNRIRRTRPTSRNGHNAAAAAVVDDNLIKSGVVRLDLRRWRRSTSSRPTSTASSSSAATSAARSTRKRRAASAARSGTSRRRASTRRRSAAGCCSRRAGPRTTRPIRPTKRSRACGPSDVGRSDRTTTEQWSTPIGPDYFRSPDRYTFSVGGLVRHRFARDQDRLLVGLWRQPASAHRSAQARAATWAAASTSTRNTTASRARSSTASAACGRLRRSSCTTPRSGPKSASTATSASTCRTPSHTSA